MPHVAIDLRMVRGRLHGIARYALELARRLPGLAPGWTFVGLAPPGGLPAGLGPLAPSIPLVSCPARFLSPLEQPALAAALVRTRCDLFHATSFSVPALWPGRLVATLHDANHLALAEDYGPGRVAYYRWIVGPRSRRAGALITVSEFSRAELAHHLKIDPGRFRIIPQGVDARFAPAEAAALADYRRRWGLPGRYVAVVGNRKRHKNLVLLAEAATRLPLPIVLLAGKGSAKALGFPPTTVDLGEHPEEEMPLFYGAARALLIPSRYEGFGLPALEAMACGCPVLAARAGSLPEVVGEGGQLLSPDDSSAWVEAVALLEDDAVGYERARKAALNAPRSSWDACAQRTLEVYRSVLNS